MSSVMPRQQRAYVIAMCAIIGGAFAYAACEWGGWTRLLYVPLRGDFTFTSQNAITILYLGLVLWGLGGFVCGALAGVVLSKIFPRPWSDMVLRLFGAWAITAVLLAGWFFTWSLWPF
jgi:hypothetical protein